MSIRKLLACVALALAPSAHAAPPLPAATIDAIARALPACTGGWHSDTFAGQTIGPAELAPRLTLVVRPSTVLTEEEGGDLYQIGKAMLFPAIGSPTWLIDGRGFLTCPAQPKEALALLEYLVGDTPAERRAPSNAFDLLGLAYQTGAAGAAAPVRARLYYLRGRIHWQVLGHDSWSDGKDQDLLANITRAGLRPYLDALTNERYGGGARLILAEDMLPRDPIQARSLLLHPESVTLGRLLDWEEQGRVPMLTDGSDVVVWAEAARIQMGYQRWIPRMIQAAERANGGTIPTAPTPPALARFHPAPDPAILKYISPAPVPIPARALVDRTGRAIYTEACQPVASGNMLDVHDRLAVARIYDPAALPPLPIARIGERPTFGWVLLPALRLSARGDDKVAIDFAPADPERCVASAMILPPPPVAPRR